MAVQKALTDDSSSTASTDLTESTTTTESMATESTGDAPPSDPLYRPIQVPEPFLPYADGTDTTAASQSQAAMIMDMEEASTSALIHAACRLHEATAVTTDAFQKLIFRWTGLTPQEAATAALVYELDRKALEDSSMEMLREQKGMMLQTVLKAMQLMAKVTGTMAGMAIDARALAVSHELLLPLSALESKDVAATFSVFTGDTTLTTTKAGRGDLIKSLRDMWLPIFHVMWTPMGGKASSRIEFHDKMSEMRSRLDTAHSQASRAQHKIDKAATATTTETDETATAARKAVQGMLNHALSKEIENMAESTLVVVDFAYSTAHWRQPLSRTVALLAARVLGRRTTEGDDDKILQQALDACKQAVAAAKMARRPAARPEM